MTISTERLNILQQTFKATAQVSETLEAAALNDAAAAISELLAVREAQSVPIGCIKTICGNKTLWWWRDAPEGAEVFTAPPAPTGPVTAVEHQRVILMLLGVCGAAFELADDCCQQEVDGELCHVVPGDSFKKLSDALDEIENTLPDEYEDLPNTVLKWAAVPRHALRAMLQPVSQGHTLNSPVIPDGCDTMPNGQSVLTDDYFSTLVNAARIAADKAMRNHPQPNYVLLKVAEEAGEVVQAGVHYAEGRMTWQDLEGEIVQLLAMLIRLVSEGDQVNGIKPPASCSTTTLAAIPDEIDIFVDQVCGNLPAGHQQ